MRLAMAWPGLWRSFLLLASCGSCWSFPGSLLLRALPRGPAHSCRLRLSKAGDESTQHLKQEGIWALRQGRTGVADGRNGLTSLVLTRACTELLTRFLERSKDADAQVLNALGSVRSNAGRWEEAIQLFSRAIDASSRAGEETRGVMSITARHDVMGAGDLSSEANAHFNLGNVFTSIDRLAEASSSFERAVEIMPSDVEAISNLALCKLKLGENKKALKQFQRAYKLDPANHVIAAERFTLGSKGNCLADAGLNSEAVDVLQGALESSDGTDAELLLNLGIAAKRSGEDGSQSFSCV
eukprot:758904-Hanusia_phi.AAC.2